MHWKRLAQHGVRNFKSILGTPTYAESLRWPDSVPGFEKASFNFTIDFELFWSNGKFDGTELSLERRIESAKAQVENFLPFLDLIEELGISLSWAVAGIIAKHQQPDAPERFAPTWAERNWYEVPEEIKEQTELWTGTTYLQALRAMKVPQEILSHGFAHIDYGDEKTSPTIARKDLDLADRALREHGFDIEGFVFPCNQIGHLETVEEIGYRILRGADQSWHVGDRSVRTPVGFWISPGVMSWNELRPALDRAIEQKSFIHPWMHLNECRLECNDLDNFYRPLFEYILNKKQTGDVEWVTYRELRSYFSASTTSA